MADLTTFTTTKRSIEMTFATATEAQHMDPDIEAATRRFMAFRRHATKENELGRTTRQNLKDYQRINAAGCGTENKVLANKILGGLPKSKERMALRRECQAFGPVGYMLKPAHLQGAQIDGEGRLKQFNQPTIDILNEPYQDLKALLQEAMERNRGRNMWASRRLTHLPQEAKSASGIAMTE